MRKDIKYFFGFICNIYIYIIILFICIFVLYILLSLIGVEYLMDHNIQDLAQQNQENAESGIFHPGSEGSEQIEAKIRAKNQENIELRQNLKDSTLSSKVKASTMQAIREQYEQDASSSSENTKYKFNKEK